MVAQVKQLDKKPIMLPSLSVVLPTRNNCYTIHIIIKKLAHLLPQVAKKYEIIVINDASQDDTDIMLEKIKKTARYLVVAHHRVKRGYGACLLTGFKKAKHDFVFYTDSRGQYDITELKVLIKAIDETTDVVTGYKMANGENWYRKWVNLFYNNFIRFLFGFRIRDIDCDFRLIRKKILFPLEITLKTHAADVELLQSLYKKNAVFKEVPVHHYPYFYEYTNFATLPNIIASFIDIIKLRFS